MYYIAFPFQSDSIPSCVTHVYILMYISQSIPLPLFLSVRIPSIPFAPTRRFLLVVTPHNVPSPLAVVSALTIRFSFYPQFLYSPSISPPPTPHFLSFHLSLFSVSLILSFFFLFLLFHFSRLSLSRIQILYIVPMYYGGCTHVSEKKDIHTNIHYNVIVACARRTFATFVSPASHTQIRTCDFTQIIPLASVTSLYYHIYLYTYDFVFYIYIYFTFQNRKRKSVYVYMHALSLLYKYIHYT